MKSLTVVLLLFIFPLGAVASAPRQLGEDEMQALCARVLTSKLPSWKRQARGNLSRLTRHAFWPVHIENAPSLIASALNIKPEEVAELPGHPFQLRISDGRLEMEIENWPRFQRAQVSLRHPEVIKDFESASHTIDHDSHDLFAMSVQANTRLFYPMRVLPHETQLGLVLPLREIFDQGPGEPPFFEMELGLLKPCFSLPESRDEQIFTGENGESLCVDPLVTLSTWPDVYLMEMK